MLELSEQAVTPKSILQSLLHFISIFNSNVWPDAGVDILGKLNGKTKMNWRRKNNVSFAQEISSVLEIGTSAVSAGVGENGSGEQAIDEPDFDARENETGRNDVCAVVTFHQFDVVGVSDLRPVFRNHLWVAN